ncbi:hypothetical protein M8J76_016085 [Diaphorina citri]|nr:hypothetical protein M8J76_016085 [Diaphorina citri]
MTLIDTLISNLKARCGADHLWVRQGSGSWNSGQSTASSNLLQTRRLSSSGPWMPQDDMTVRGVGALRYPSIGNLQRKNYVDSTSCDSFQGGDSLSTNAFPSGKSGPVNRSVSPTDQYSYYSGSLADFQNGNLPLPPISTSKPDESHALLYQQQKDCFNYLESPNAFEKSTHNPVNSDQK